MSSGVEAAKSAVAQSESAGPRRGSIVAGRFRLGHLLGEGGMGQVWSAEHVMTKKRVALKVLKQPASPELVRRFVREARALSAVRHPNVIEVHDVVSLDDGLPAMVLDLLEGETLASRLERTRTVPAPELLDLMLPLVSALAAIHRAGIVHRDLKPDNVFLARLGDGRVEPMLLDFGVCKLAGANGALVESGRPTAAGRMMGTPSYMAPEQVRGDADVDARVDVWALGVVLHECLTGQPPFVGDTMADVVRAITSAPVPRLATLVPDAPAQLVELIQRLLVRDRAQRVSDLAEVHASLLAARDTPKSLRASPPERSVITAVTVKRPPRPITLDVQPMMTSVPPPSRARRSKVLVFAGGLALVGAFGVFLTRAPAAPVAARSLPAPSAARPAEPAAVPAPSTAPRVSAVQVAELRPLAKAAAKPPARTKAMRPIPNYGGRR